MLPEIDTGLVRVLLRAQFPAWAELPLEPVAPVGNDHRMFRIGTELAARLPRDADRAGQIRKEQGWLPQLAPQVPLAIPTLVGIGTPSDAFPLPWSVLEWMPGRPARPDSIRDDSRVAADLAGFLRALRGADAAGAPGPGVHSFFRGGGLEQADEEVAAIITRVDGPERSLARELWREARGSRWTGAGVWVHGDVAAANLLVTNDRLTGVVDFGCAAVGDPACDTVARWTLFRGDARQAFVRELDLDDDTWARGRGWALWKALIMITNRAPGQAAFARELLDELFTGA